MQHYNQLFGIIPFAGHVEKRSVEERSKRYQKMHERTTHLVEKPPDTGLLHWSNVLYTVLFAPVASLPYLLLGILLQATVVGAPYGRRCLSMFWFQIWPFGKFVQRRRGNVDTSSLLAQASGGGEDGGASTSSRPPKPVGIGKEVLCSRVIRKAGICMHVRLVNVCKIKTLS